MAFLVLLCAAIIVGVSFGIRQSFGLFMRPITIDLGWRRETLSMVIAVQALLNGVAAQNESEYAAYLIRTRRIKLSGEQLAEAKQMVRDWKPGDCPSAEHRLGPPRKEV